MAWSEVTGLDDLACDPCVPDPAFDALVECYQDSECGKGAHCEVDMVACPQPSYCARCFDSCQPNGLVCTTCIDCAYGGTCVPD